MKFESTKTKELLACLVDAEGGICTNQEIIALLWEDDGRHDSYLKKLRKDLIDTFEKHGCEEVICRQRGGMGILTDKVECDYYEWKNNNHDKKKPSNYMSQYYWGYFPEYEL